MYQPATSPQSIGGVLDDGFRLFRASLPQVVVLAFVGTLAGQLPNMLGADPQSLSGIGAALLVAFVVSLLLSLGFYGAVVGRMNGVARQQELSVGDALSLGLRRLLPLVAVTVLYIIVLMLGFLLLLVPGIIFGLSLMFSFYVVLLEGKGPLAGLAESHRLVWGNWWRTLVIVSVATVIVMAAYLLVLFAVGLVFAVGDSVDFVGRLRMVEIIVTPLLGAVAGPLFYALSLAAYYDLKLRRSGADLEARLDSTVGA